MILKEWNSLIFFYHSSLLIVGEIVTLRWCFDTSLIVAARWKTNYIRHSSTPFWSYLFFEEIILTMLMLSQCARLLIENCPKKLYIFSSLYHYTNHSHHSYTHSISSHIHSLTHSLTLCVFRIFISKNSKAKHSRKKKSLFFLLVL